MELHKVDEENYEARFYIPGQSVNPLLRDNLSTLENWLRATVGDCEEYLRAREEQDIMEEGDLSEWG